MLTPRIPFTASAAATPSTSRRMPALGVGIIRTPAARGSRDSPSMSSPTAWRKINSSSEIPAPNFNVREQRPPIERGAISIIQIPRSSIRSSACSGPWRRPSARAVAVTQSASSRCCAAGRRDGVTYSVSSKKGPSSGSGLSNSASTCSSPASSNPSSATSSPGTNSSTSSSPAAGSRRSTTSGEWRMRAIRWKAATNSSASFARITPRLAERNTGFSTHG